MLSLTGTPLFVLAVAAAIVPVLVIAWLARKGGAQATSRRRITRVVTVTALVLLAQGAAMAALALKVNDKYTFYTSWADLTGQIAQGATIQTGGILPTGEGTIRVMSAPARNAGTNHEVLVWLPPQYDDPAYKSYRFPVVMFLTGQPSTPTAVFDEFNFASTAAQAIASHQAQPFIGVFPSLMVTPPRDTECTNVPGGPMAETWLSSDVPSFIERSFRVAAPGRAWTAMGWSTGGFCASKLLMAHHDHFGSAVSFGGYYTPIQDATTGDLFAGQRKLYDENSPQWLYTKGGLHGDRLLLVAGQQDKNSWGSTKRMLEVTAGNPNIASITFPVGGHNYRDYSSYLASALAWAAKGWPGDSDDVIAAAGAGSG